MCGISGIISFNGADPSLARDLASMNAKIGHRGPDDEGFLFSADGKLVPYGSSLTPDAVLNADISYTPTSRSIPEHIAPTFGFGHRRLSIIDLSAKGHQPLSYYNRYWITFNGEIYNYKELRRELESLGETFSTETDTEVILACYHRWGDDCFSRFNGMWALMIYDEAEKKFIASRDRYGVKPFYYFENGDHFCFASEQKAFTALPYFTAEVNDNEVFDFFILNKFESKEEGFFRNIKELKPGHTLSFSDKGERKKITKYFRDPSFEKINISDNEASAKTLELLSDSVRLRLRSDVSVGSCLSGGIDSSAIVALMRRNEGTAPLHVFTASFPGAAIDETKYAGLVAERTGATWHKVTPDSAGLLKDLEELIYCQDIPIWSTSTYAQFRVMKLVKESGIKVILDGQGGDELFAGYHTYYYPFWQTLLRKGKYGTLHRELKAFGPGAVKHYMRLLFKEKLIPSLAPDLQLKIYLSLYPELRYMNREFLYDHKHLLKENEAITGDLSRSLYNEYYGERLKGYLKCEDRCAMNFSVESRVPFADDPALAEFVFSLKDNMKIRGGVNKYILRESLKGIVPEEILQRRDKMGYVTPNNRWIGEIRNSIKDYFTSHLDPFINTQKVLADYDRLFDPKGDIDTGRVFKYISFAVWMKLHFNKA